MPVQVANIWKHHRTEDEVRVYIGRACRGYSRSALANPFRRDDEGSKEQAILRYREWLRDQLREPNSAAAREILRLGQMVAGGTEVTLLCWCSPASCHGDVVQVAVERVASRLSVL